MDIAPSLPTKFPCWCRAVYSWGGETKKDLGFIEGDLIECLNAGDGQWWMGRLRRDKRAVGLFPSNFVKVLDESFVPVSRGSSPATGSLNTAVAPKKDKSVFRKPFQAYSAYIPEVKKEPPPTPKPVRPISRAHESQTRRNSAQKELKVVSRTQQLREAPNRRDSNRSYLSGASTRDYTYQQPMQHPRSRENSYQHSSEPVPSPNGQYHNQQQTAHSRQSSLQFSQQADDFQTSHQASDTSRRLSYVQPSESFRPNMQEAHAQYRAPSPMQPPPPPPPPPQHHSRAAPSPSPDPYEDTGDGPPPPPPPPHRVNYATQPTYHSRAPSPFMHDRYPAMSRTPSPMPHSPGLGMTPSPLRDAIDDVLDSLQDMSTDMSSRLENNQESPKETEPFNPWSPEAFEELRTGPRRKAVSRAQTSIGIAQEDSGYGSLNGMDSGYGSQSSTDGWKERMESRLEAMKDEPGYSASRPQTSGDLARPITSGGPRPVSVLGRTDSIADSQRKLRNRKSAYELGKDIIGRTFTTKSIASNTTQSTHAQSTTSAQSNQTLMSGHSAGAFSATSAGSFARRKLGSLRRAGNRPMSVAGTRAEDEYDGIRPESQLSGPTYHPSHSSQQSRPMSAMEKPGWVGSVVNSGDPLGGLTKLGHAAAPPQLKSKRSGFLRKLVDSAKAGAASARNTIGSGSPEKEVRRKSMITPASSGIGNTRSLAEEMGLGAGIDWMQVRRDVNRSNSLSAIERQERQERCELMNQPVIAAVDDLMRAAEGEEGLDGMPVVEPTNFRAVNMQLVDKAARFVTNLPPMTNAIGLAQGYLCRQHRSDVQRLRAIFTWVSERIAWEEDFEGEVDTMRVIQSRRGCAEEVAVLVMEMCQAVGLHAEVVGGHLKPPGEVPDVDKMPRPNHWWNAVLVDGEWRIMDCSLAAPTNPKRAMYSSASSQAADSWYFLMRPLEACYTHIPSYVTQQHIVPPVSPDTLLALPCACPPFFKHGLAMVNYDTSLHFLNDLEIMQLHISVPSDVELYAEVETRAYVRDLDGDTYESGDLVRKRALAQPEWVDGVKRFTIKALLPGDEGQGRLLVYAGKRGLMHSIKDNPHSLALSLPIVHAGQNPHFDFFIRHPTPHAQRHDLYIAQPQCHRLAYGNTFVFAVRQHPSSIPNGSGSGVSGIMSSSPAFGRSGLNGATSPLPFRPGSALSISSSSASGSNFGPTAGSSAYSSSSSGMGSVSSGNGVAIREKPAKLAVQSPSGKIMRMSRKHGEAEGDFGGGTWEAYIKVGEKGTWRGLVLADRSARWCVFGEWECA